MICFNGFCTFLYSFYIYIELMCYFKIVENTQLNSLPDKIDVLRGNSLQLTYNYVLQPNEIFKEFVIQFYTLGNIAYTIARKIGEGPLLIQIDNVNLSKCYNDRLYVNNFNNVVIDDIDYICDNKRRIQSYILIAHEYGNISVKNSAISVIFVIVPPIIYHFDSIQNVLIGDTNTIIKCYTAGSPCPLIKWKTSIVAKKTEKITIQQANQNQTSTIYYEDAKNMLDESLNSSEFYNTYNCLCIGLFFMPQVEKSLQNKTIECIASVDLTSVNNQNAIYPQTSKTVLFNVLIPPSKPLNLTIPFINSTHVLVEWQPPANIGNPPKIDKYQISLYKLLKFVENNDEDSSNYARFLKQHIESKNNNNGFSINVCNETLDSTDQQQLHDCLLLMEINDIETTYFYYDSLFLNTYYVVKVIAINSAGAGPSTTSHLFNGPNRIGTLIQEKYVILAIIILSIVVAFILIIVAISQCKKHKLKKLRKRNLLTIKSSDTLDHNQYIKQYGKQHWCGSSVNNLEKILYENDNHVNCSHMHDSSLDKILPTTYAKYPPPPISAIDNDSTNFMSNQYKPSFNLSANSQQKNGRNSYLFRDNQSNYNENASNTSGYYKIMNNSHNESSSELQTSAQIKNIKSSTYV